MIDEIDDAIREMESTLENVRRALLVLRVLRAAVAGEGHPIALGDAGLHGAQGDGEGVTCR